jgi:cobalt/nickel transport system ATP-binding protein
MNLIEVMDISFAYHGGHKALDHLSLSIAAGERVAVMGPNGAGKSTLFQMFNGLLKPDAGQVEVDGLPVAPNHLPTVRRKVGMVFQDSDDQLFNATVYREVAYGLVNMKVPQDELNATVRWALDMVGMIDFIDKTPFNLSGGEKKRIALASVLSMKPQILVLDEPTSALDPKSASHLLALLNKLNHDLGITLVFATHDVDIVPLLANRMVLMDHGSIQFSGTPTEVFREKDLLRRLDLRLPRIAHLAEILMRDGLLPAGDLPLSIGQARELLKRVLAGFSGESEINADSLEESNNILKQS